MAAAYGSGRRAMPRAAPLGGKRAAARWAPSCGVGRRLSSRATCVLARTATARRSARVQAPLSPRSRHSGAPPTPATEVRRWWRGGARCTRAKDGRRRCAAPQAPDGDAPPAHHCPTSPHRSSSMLAGVERERSEEEQ
ncbi:hypothetical protein SEVIR_5G132600v4 [Setaria viridis]|uniref:Uncharacterized protein n=2 Tax=Setaria TaxID=4554 RepID=A0A368R4B0_SETIT|nr:hypothetical protein SETIT_5G134400v2 [Setaria italica]TKW13923.1 hypothetical protein SEVIR_5G132600v2 [Setaria viridis]